jgi:D-alanyl-D-alanine carboxypeptidase
MHAHRFARTSFALVFALVGCAASGTDDTTSEVAALDARDASESCRIQHERLDAAISHTPHDATYDALLAVRSASCGASFHVAGPSHLDAHRLVRVGSNTKTYVAIATLGLVGEGRIALDARLDAYLPDAPAAVAAVTVRQLLQHTSGIFNYTNTDAFWEKVAADPLHPLQPSELVAMALTQPPYFAPGAGWEYSNTNYILLGMMLEHLTGSPIATVIRERILHPNGLEETFLDGSEPVRGELAPGYFVHMGSFAPWQDGADISHAYDLSWAWSAGAMVATASDLSRFFELVGGGALLPAALQAELVNGVATAQPGLRYGLGVFLADSSITGGAGNGIGHGGDVMGYHSTAWYFPDSKTAMAGAVDSDKGSGNDVAVAGLTALFSGGLERRAAARKLLPSQL